MRIVITKPEWGITGGFELVLSDVAATLRDAGHEVTWATVPALVDDRRVGGIEVPDVHWAAAPEFFVYASLLERFARLDVSGADLVVTTQPGSWAVDHPRKLAVFYHHHRVAYDLEDAYVAAHLGDDTIHRAASRLIRELDRPHLESVSHFLVPSATVAARLAHHNGVPETAMSRYLAVPQRIADPATDRHRGSGRRRALCVSRSEFTKRTELFAAAAFEDLGGPADLVGEGGRLPFVRRYVADRARGVPRAPEPWNAPASPSTAHLTVDDAPLAIHGWVDGPTLDALYARAGVVVAPAMNEDYGLTVLEAMAHGAATVVCDDGGGLVEMVDDGTTGLVTEAEPAALAATVRSLLADPDRAQAMGEAGREAVSAYTRERAGRQLLDGVEAAMAS